MTSNDLKTEIATLRNALDVLEKKAAAQASGDRWVYFVHRGGTKERVNVGATALAKVGLTPFGRVKVDRGSCPGNTTTGVLLGFTSPLNAAVLFDDDDGYWNVGAPSRVEKLE